MENFFPRREITCLLNRLKRENARQLKQQTKELIPVYRNSLNSTGSNNLMQEYWKENDIMNNVAHSLWNA